MDGLLRSRSWVFALVPSFVLLLFIRRQRNTMARVLAFLNRRHIEIESSDVLTLFQLVRRRTGALLSSLSTMVRRQSSMASLTAVMTTMTIRGTADKPGFTTPKM